jgi:hypothetical protein
MNLIKVHYEKVWKYHNETPLNNKYTLIKMGKEKKRKKKENKYQIWPQPLE